jgi:hypothetical protein
MRTIQKLRIVLCFLGLFAATAAPVAQPNSRTGPRPGNALSAASTCLLATEFYKVPTGVHTPVRLYDIDPTTGAASNARVTAAPGLIGLAWGPDKQLYGVSTFAAPTGYQSNALYRIDPATGATTLVGPTGLASVYEGDLATDPATGTIYAISQTQVFRFQGLTAGSVNSTATLVGTINIAQGPGWDSNGLAFDPSGKLYALLRPQSAGGGPPLLLTLNPSNASVQTSVPLSQNVYEVGGLEFVGGKLLYAEGNQTGFLAAPGDQYQLMEINPANGVVTAKGFTNIPAGVSSLVSCVPPNLTCTPPPPDMDAWYPMDGNPNDLILGKNAVASGGVTYPNGKVAQAAFLNNGYLTIPNGPVLNQGLGDFSIDLWTFRLASQNGVVPLIDKRVNAAGGVLGWSLFLYQGRPALQLADGAWGNYIDSRTLASGWHHIAVTVDRNNPQGIVFYVDGVPGQAMNPTAHQGNLDNSAPTSFGRHSLDSSLAGSLLIDEIEFFDRALAGSEIAAISSAGLSGKCK